MTAWCEKQGWKPVPVNSGHFMMVNASNLDFKTMDDEKEFGRVCVEHGVGVVSTNFGRERRQLLGCAQADTQGLGQSYHAAEPGWLRLTHTYEPERLDLALGRLGKAVEAWHARV